MCLVRSILVSSQSAVHDIITFDGKTKITFFLQGNVWQQLLSFHFVLELVNTIPFMLTVSTKSQKFASFAEILTARCIIDLSAFVASAAELVHPSFPQLLASETLIREYVCEYTVFLVIIYN